MTQQPNFTATETPQDIGAGLAPGDYIAQVRWFPIPQVAVIYATAPAAPVDPDDYFQCEAGNAFLFSVGAGIAPTWVRVAPWTLREIAPDTFDLPVAIARTGA